MESFPAFPVIKPRSLMIFGILNIVLGAYSLLTSIPSVFMMLNPAKYASNPVIQVMRDDHVYATFQKAMIVPGLLGMLALLASGIGLVKAREWGRKLAIVWSWYMIVTTPLVSWMLAVHVHPTMMKQIMEQAGKQGGSAVASDFMATILKIVTVASVALYVVYGILQIIMLSRGKVKGYCSRPLQAPPSPSAP